MSDDAFCHYCQKPNCECDDALSAKSMNPIKDLKHRWSDYVDALMSDKGSIKVASYLQLKNAIDALPDSDTEVAALKDEIVRLKAHLLGAYCRCPQETTTNVEGHQKNCDYLKVINANDTTNVHGRI